MLIWGNRVATIVLYGLSIAIVVYMLHYMRHGVDFTDEGYYLVWIRDPFYYDWSTSQFGFLYYILFRFLSYDIYFLRIANILITYALSFFLSLSVFALAAKDLGPRILRIALACAIATMGLIFLFYGLPTPSYNTLALQGILVTAIGQIHAGRELSRVSLAGWALIGLGGWLTFMAKPSSAALLAPSVLVFLILANKWNFRGLALAIFLAALLLLGSAYWIDGSPGSFYSRIAAGLEIGAATGAGYTFGDIVRWDDLSLSRLGWYLAFTLAGFLLLSGIIYRARWTGPIAALRAATLLACCVAILLVAVRWSWIPSGFGQERAVLLAFPIVAIIAKLSAFARSGLPGFDFRFPNGNRENCATAFSFCAMPLIYAFGSNQNYWSLGGDAGLFWALAAILLSTPAQAAGGTLDRFIPLALAAQTLSLLFLQHGVAQPYRQPGPLWADDQTVEFGSPPSTLVLSSGFATYVREARSRAEHAGFLAQTPLIDLTGQSPGLLYAIGAKSVGYPWLSGGYPGSTLVVRTALARVSCADLARSWVLIEPTGPRSVDSGVLSVFGARMDIDYAVAAEWQTAERAGGYPERRAQQLLRPLRGTSSASSACVEALRANAAQLSVTKSGGIE